MTQSCWVSANDVITATEKKESIQSSYMEGSVLNCFALLIVQIHLESAAPCLSEASRVVWLCYIKRDLHNVVTYVRCAQGHHVNYRVDLGLVFPLHADRRRAI